MMKKKDIQAMLDNHLKIETEITQNMRAVARNHNIDYEVKQMKLDSLASKEELNEYAIFLLKRILES
ncbi:MAG: hypothetical protein ACRC7S_08955 [Cetobacterium sp.]